MSQNLKLAFYLGEKHRNPKTTLLDQVICYATRSPYSHVELVYHFEESTNTASCWSSSAPDKGVRRKDIVLHPDRWELYELHNKKPSDEMHAWFAQQNGKPYDYFGAIGTKFFIFRQDHRKWFCSEIISYYLKHHRPHRQTPHRLYRTNLRNMTKIELQKRSYP